jgi:type VI secretion system protein ImpM
MPGPTLSGAPTPIDADATPGWYGKVVMLGDFANRRLSHDFVAACDDWLSRGVAASRAQLGSRWLDVYLTGPLWRFAWTPGVVGARWWFGTLMPSVDAVGRYFPLVVASARRGAPASAHGFDALADWYRHVGQAALATLQPGATLDALEAALAGAPAWHDDAAAPDPVLESLAARERFSVAQAPTLQQWAEALVWRVAMARYAGHSFWWPTQAAGEPVSLSVVPGLPDAQQFAAMLEGRW